METIRAYVKRSSGLVTCVTLPRFGTPTDGIALYITTRCKYLQELTIQAGIVGKTLLCAAPTAMRLKTLVVGSQCLLSGDCAEQLLENCPNLERVEFHSVEWRQRHRLNLRANIPKLQSLMMKCSAKERSSDRGLGGLLQRIPNIRTLILHHWGMPWESLDLSSLRELETLDLNDLHRGDILQLPSSLRTLLIPKSFGAPLDVTHWQLPELSRLSIADATGLTFSSVQMILVANKGKLTHFDGRACLVLRCDLIDLILNGYFTDILELGLSCCYVDDDIVALLVQHAPAIKRLQLACTNVTGVGIKSLVTGLGRLEYLNLDNCHRCSRDAVDWANAKGVKTSFRFAVDTARNGNKVRY